MSLTVLISHIKAEIEDNSTTDIIIRTVFDYGTPFLIIMINYFLITIDKLLMLLYFLSLQIFTLKV